MYSTLSQCVSLCDCEFLLLSCPVECRSQHSAALTDLDVKRTQLVWESNKLSEAESKLYHSEQQHARKREDLTKLRIRLQESSEKLNQGECIIVLVS